MKSMTLLVALGAASAFAQAGAVLDGADLPSATRAALLAEVATARRTDPRPFAAVQAVRSKVVALDKAKRGLFAPLSPWLSNVPGVQWALLEALVVDGQLTPGAPSSALLAWQVGLLEALGAQRTPAAEPVLVAVLNKQGLALPVTRAAAQALGKLGSDAAVAALLGRARVDGELGRAVELGLGDCRRAAVAEHLERAVTRQGEPPARRVWLIRALARLASSWVLATPNVLPVQAEASAIRAAAARGLVQAWLSGSGDVLQEAQDALRIIDAPETFVLLEARRVVDPASVDALKAALRR